MNPIYTDAEKAREHLEATVWPDGPICPHCGVVNQATKLEGTKHRPGLYQCNEKGCREQFTATVGTIFERSKIPLNTWLYAVSLLTASKKGFSAHQLHRMIGVTYKTAWFMMHRIREAMKDDSGTLLGGEGKSVQADETYYGNTSKRAKHYRKGFTQKECIFALVEPGAKARVIHVASGPTMKTAYTLLAKHADTKSSLHTDEAPIYRFIGTKFASHLRVKHSNYEYKGPQGQHTNNAENFFGIFKRGMVGVYHKCEPQHLQRYLTEFEFRYNNRIGLGVDDATRADKVLKGITGRRLMYRRSNKAQAV
jgi:transposase-like protein